jgi:hypothetical protein
MASPVNACGDQRSRKKASIGRSTFLKLALVIALPKLFELKRDLERLGSVQYAARSSPKLRPQDKCLTAFLAATSPTDALKSGFAKGYERAIARLT